MSNDIKANLIIKKFFKELKTDSFCCENDDVNKFFQEKANFNDQNLLSKLYICINQINKEIAGFISLSTFRLNLPDSNKYGIRQVPAALLGRLAIENKYRGLNLGKDLIQYAIGVCCKVKDLIGCRLFITEIPIDDPILNYFLENGFNIERTSKKFHYLSIDLLINT